MKFTDNNITPGLNSKILAETASEDKGYLTPQQLKTLIAPSLGAGVETALNKATGTLGAVQLVGDVLTPSAIQLPDMTGLTAPVGYIGLKNGQLAVADNVTPGGNLVTPSRRFVGSKKVNFSGQSFTRAFAKVMSIPMTAEEMQNGKNYQLIGEFSFYCGDSSGMFNVTKVLFGMSWLSGSVLSQGATNNPGPNFWNGTPIVPPSSLLTKTYTKYNFSQRISAQASNVYLADWNSGGILRDLNEFAISHYPGSNVITNNNISSFGPVPIAPTGVANEICLMLQFDRSDTGTYSTTQVLTTWNLELVSLN